MMDYQLRKDFIAKVLCINRNKPKLHCNGKCYLANKLKLEEERENKTKAGNLKEKAEQLFLQQTLYFIFPSTYKTSTPTLLPFENSLYYLTPLFSVFHPPKSK